MVFAFLSNLIVASSTSGSFNGLSKFVELLRGRDLTVSALTDAFEDLDVILKDPPTGFVDSC